MSKGLSRRDFMKASLIGGAALGAGLGHGHFHFTHAQSANVRFSTWHVPVGYGGQNRRRPCSRNIKKKSGGKNHFRPCMPVEPWAREHNIVSVSGHRLTLRDLDAGEVPFDRRAFSCSLGGR